MKNMDIRDEMRRCRIFGAELSDELGIAESTLYRKLRHELDEDDKKKILAAIHKLAGERRAVR